MQEFLLWLTWESITEFMLSGLISLEECSQWLSVSYSWELIHPSNILLGPDVPISKICGDKIQGILKRGGPLRTATPHIHYWSSADAWEWKRITPIHENTEECVQYLGLSPTPRSLLWKLDLFPCFFWASFGGYRKKVRELGNEELSSECSGDFIFDHSPFWP